MILNIKTSKIKKHLYEDDNVQAQQAAAQPQQQVQQPAQVAAQPQQQVQQPAQPAVQPQQQVQQPTQPQQQVQQPAQPAAQPQQGGAFLNATNELLNTIGKSIQNLFSNGLLQNDSKIGDKSYKDEFGKNDALKQQIEKIGESIFSPGNEQWLANFVKSLRDYATKLDTESQQNQVKEQSQQNQQPQQQTQQNEGLSWDERFRLLKMTEDL